MSYKRASINPPPKGPRIGAAVHFFLVRPHLCIYINIIYIIEYKRYQCGAGEGPRIRAAVHVFFSAAALILYTVCPVFLFAPQGTYAISQDSFKIMIG